MRARTSGEAAVDQEGIACVYRMFKKETLLPMCFSVLNYIPFFPAYIRGKGGEMSALVWSLGEGCLIISECM